ncbi:Cysteine protease atg4c [Cichlidogyrus casuarinus]|uniref:Cysteine protease n=1 Tax=Cichlidogyrus casuarinus TaxID=1844966 RepID=A0ABD2PPZ1_9PLAT
MLVLRLFADQNSRCSPFSLHNILEAGEKPPGHWFGPASICKPIITLLSSGRKNHFILDNLEVYLALDRVICYKEMHALLGRTPETACSMRCQGHFCTLHTGKADPRDGKSFRQRPANRAMLLLIPVMLGSAKSIDISQLSTLFDFVKESAFVGILGGEPRRSIYICGLQDDKIIYLDPHLSQEFVDMSCDQFSAESYYSKIPKTLPAKKLDPSMTVGLYCKDSNELDDLCLRIKNGPMGQIVQSCCNSNLAQQESLSETTFSDTSSFSELEL